MDFVTKPRALSRQAPEHPPRAAEDVRYLMESERKSYNPLRFCKIYHMVHQPVNTREQEDMAEFFINLLS